MKQKTVILPSHLELLTAEQYIAPCLTATGQAVADRIIFDFSRLSFAKPTGVTAFANLLAWLNDAGVAVDFANLPLAPPFSESVRYLDDSRFFERFRGAPLDDKARSRTTTLDLTQIQHADTHQWLETAARPWLEHSAGLGPGSLAEFVTCCK